MNNKNKKPLFCVGDKVYSPSIEKVCIITAIFTNVGHKLNKKSGYCWVRYEIEYGSILGKKKSFESEWHLYKLN